MERVFVIVLLAVPLPSTPGLQKISLIVPFFFFLREYWVHSDEQDSPLITEMHHRISLLVRPIRSAPPVYALHR
jgi:hypothetical protein